MASKRNLKKQVNYIISELFTECLVCKAIFPKEENEKKLDELIEKIVDMQNEFIGRLNHVEPGNIKGSYKKFHEDFNREVGTIIESISKLH